MLGEQLDPEDLGELMLGYQEMAREVVDRFGGSVAQFLGDGVLAYFGAPVAYEDDADRAVMTGLAILDGMVDQRRKAKELGAQSFEARVGIHTGPVVIGSTDSPDRVDTPVFGSSINIASRLEGFAAPGSVVVSDATVRLLRGRYSLSDRGTPKLKGINRPLRVWEVLSAIESAEARRTLRKETVIGRAEQLGAVLDAIDAASSVGCQVVLVKGEPGVGKSTLLHCLFDALAERPHRWLEFQCSELASATPLHPVITGTRRLVGIHQYDPAETQVAKLESALEVLGTKAAGVMPFIADFLEIRVDTGPALQNLSPEVRRHRLLEALTDWAMALAAESLLVLVTEDLQWADPTTLELLRRLAERAAPLPVVLIATSRQPLPESWTPSAFTEIQVDRLSQSESRELVSRLGQGLGLSDDSVGILAERGGGVPLFIEELVRSVGEGSDPSGVPETLQSLLLASLDGLGEAKSTAQAAAVLGREFSVGVLAALIGVDEPQLTATLDRLTVAGVLSAGLSTEGRRYAFRHALIQDAAYDSLLRRRRRELHDRVGDVLIQRFPLEAESQPGLVAHHLSAARRDLEAAHWFTTAGRRAVERAALQEAVTHYESGIAAIRDLEPGDGRDRSLLTLLLLCGNAFMGISGPGGNATVNHWELAMTVADRIGDVEELTSAMNGLATYWFDQGRIDRTIDLAERILDIGESSGSRIAALRGNCTLGLAYLMRGDVERSLHHSATGISLEEEGDFLTVTYGVGHDEGVLARWMSSWALWWLGRPDACLAMAVEADRRAKALPSSLTQAMAGFVLALAHFLRGEAGLAKRIARQNVDFCEELGVPFWLALALLVLGTQRSLDGETGGLDDLDRAFGLLLELDNASASPIGLALLADSQRSLGLHDQALATVDAGLDAAEAADQSLYVPELLRVKASTTTDLGRRPEAVDLFRRSIATAARMGAASFRLRSALDLARLLIDEPASHAETAALLAEAVAGMADGSATEDQVAARRLLGSLGHPLLVPGQMTEPTSA